MRRQLLWLLAGIVMLPVLLLATAPELVRADPSAAMSLLGLVLAAGIPGLVLLAVIAVRGRRARTSDQPGDDAPSSEPDALRTTHRDHPPETP